MLTLVKAFSEEKAKNRSKSEIKVLELAPKAPAAELLARLLFSSFSEV